MRGDDAGVQAQGDQLASPVVGAGAGFHGHQTTGDLNGFYDSKGCPEHLRRIRYKAPVPGKALVFLTNNTALPPLAIAALYKSRWQVELFFEWIGQHWLNT